LKKYLPFFAKYKKALWLAPLLVIIDVGCEIVQPNLMSKIVDVGIGHKSMSYILQTGALMVGLSLVAIAANIGNIYFSSQASVGFSAELRKSMFEKIQQFSFSNLDKFSSASLVTRITNDVNILQEVIMMALRLLIRAPLMLLFALVIAIHINSTLAIIIGVAMPVLALCIFFILRRGLPYFEKMQKQLDWLNTLIQENLVNVRVVKSFTREPFEEEKFGGANDRLRDIATRASGMVVLIMPVMQLVMNLSIVAIVWFGGNEIMTGSFRVGGLMSFITYITQILMSLMMLSMTIMTFSRATASAERIWELLRTRPDISDMPGVREKNLVVQQGRVEFRNVFFRYDPKAKTDTLKNINLLVQAGETVGIIGATGSSKSTLVQLIPRLYDVYSGQILIDNLDIKEYSLQNLRNGVGMVLQQNELFSGTIRENLQWGDPSASDEMIMAAARDAQAHEFIMDMPQQYDTILGQGGVNVSGGQKQRLCIARAILKKPRILVLDDSTSAVDMLTEARIREGFKNHLRKVTIFIISQRISSLRNADRILVMDEGAIAGNGRHEELMQSNALYREIYQSQQLNEELIS